MPLPVTVGGKISAVDINNLGNFPVSTFSALPSTGNWLGRQIAALDTGVTSRWNGSAWILDYEVYTNAITARAGYAVISQTVRRQGRSVMVQFSTTKNVGNWGSGDLAADITVAAIRPDNAIAVGTAWDQNVGVVTKTVLFIPDGAVQVLGAGGLAGSNIIHCSFTYLVDTL